MNVLIIAAEFAPLNTTGNYRTLKFVKYLHKYGITPVVLTLTVEGAIETFGKKIDQELISSIPEGTQVIRVPIKPIPSFVKDNKILNFARIFLSTDDKIAKRWLVNLKFHTNKILADHSPSVIYISAPPFSMYRIADFFLSKNIPIVVDMRDGWSNWCIAPWQSRLHHYLAYKKERKFLKLATKIITTTNELAQQFFDTHSFLTSDSVDVIYNGYDGDLLGGCKVRSLGLEYLNRPIKIGYIGSFYFDPKAHNDKEKSWWKRSPRKMFQYTPLNEDWSYRSPLYFFKTIKNLFVKDPSLKNKLTIELVGSSPDWLKQMVFDYGLSDNIVYHGFVSSSKVKEIANNFDYFLATSEKMIGKNHVFMPSKLFDYISLAKPILGFVTEGAQKNFLLESGVGVILDPDDIETSTLSLLKIFKHGLELSVNKNYLKSFSRENATSKLANIFKTLA